MCYIINSRSGEIVTSYNKLIFYLHKEKICRLALVDALNTISEIHDY